MARFLSRLQQMASGWYLISLDPYTALGLKPDASTEQILLAYEYTLSRVRSNRWRRFWAQLCGQNPAQLRKMRDELLNAQSRSVLDRDLELIRVFFQPPPQ